MKTYSIYTITCKTEGRAYAGMTGNIILRKQAHLSTLRSGAHSNKLLQEAFLKYGEDDFIFKVIETYNSYKEAINAENILIALKGHYNIIRATSYTRDTPPASGRKKIPALELKKCIQFYVSRKDILKHGGMDKAKQLAIDAIEKD